MTDTPFQSTDTITSDPCMICYLDIDQSQEMICPECNKSFHANCLNEWMKHAMTCPNCRYNILFYYIGIVHPLFDWMLHHDNSNTVVDSARMIHYYQADTERSITRHWAAYVDPVQLSNPESVEIGQAVRGIESDISIDPAYDHVSEDVFNSVILPAIRIDPIQNERFRITTPDDSNFYDILNRNAAVRQSTRNSLQSTSSPAVSRTEQLFKECNRLIHKQNKINNGLYLTPRQVSQLPPKHLRPIRGKSRWEMQLLFDSYELVELERLYKAVYKPKKHTMIGKTTWFRKRVKRYKRYRSQPNWTSSLVLHPN